MTHINIFRTTKKFFTKTIIISLCLLVNFTQASEITKISPEILQPQINTIELAINDKMEVYQFPNQEEYLLVCTNNRRKKGERYYKIYKGSLDFLTQPYVKSHSEGSENKEGKIYNHLSINTPVGTYTNGKYFDKNAPDFPAWHDKTENQYIHLISCFPTDDILNKIVWKDIDEEV